MTRTTVTIKRALGWMFIVLVTLFLFPPSAQRLVRSEITPSPGSLSTATSASGNPPAQQQANANEERPRNGTVNVLVIGIDDVEGSHRADTLMLAVVNTDSLEVSLVSIPRDLRVPLAGRGWDKINAAYVYGGAGLTVRTVEEVIGLPVDYYITVDYLGFKRIVDRLGGLQYTVEQRMYYVDRSQKLVIDLHPGPQHLDGDHALQYVRFRADDQGDLGRIARQQRLLLAALAQWRTPATLAKLPTLAPGLLSLVHTNLSAREALRLAGVMRGVKTDEVRTTILPGRITLIDGISYLVTDLAQLRQTVTSFLHPNKAPQPLPPRR